VNEPDSVQDSWLAENSRDLAWADPAESAAAKLLSLQLHLDLGSPTAQFAPFPASDSIPEDELTYLRSQVQKQVDRIHNLERALDQSLISLEELRLQLVDQQFLENQLAATEDIANIQQRAITQLKQQLAQQQQTLELQQAQTQQQTQSFQELLSLMENLAEGQQTRLAHLKVQILTDRSTIPHEQADSTSQSHAADVAQIAVLTQQLDVQEETIAQQELKLEQNNRELQQQQALIESLQQRLALVSAVPESSLDQELFTAHCKIQDLETQLSKQVTTQAILQHTCQELEQARDRYQSRAAELELQTADMQEQILQQAQQGAEYETAVQHWKDRYVNSQEHLKRLKILVEQAQLHPSPELVELLTAIQAIVDSPEPESMANLASRNSKMDIPDFLARHHRYRVRS